MTHRAPTLQRPRHCHQRGMTLIELMVSITILAIIGGSTAAAFGIGLHVLGPNGAQAQLTGSHDVLAFEQQIGADVARAVCLSAPGSASVPTGGCASSVQKSPSTCVTGYLVCLAWFIPGSSTCHTVSYTETTTTDVIVRTDSAGSTERFTTGGLLATPSWTSATIDGYQWTSQVTVSVTQKNTPGAPSTNYANDSFVLVPLVTDPMSPVVAGGTTPC